MAGADRLKYSILLPTLHRPRDVGEFLASVSAQTRPPDEVVCIDQSDDARTREVFEAWREPSSTRKIYVHRKVKSLILARHAGIDASGAVDLVVFFDDDLILDPECCERMLQVFERDRESRYGGGMVKIIGSSFKSAPLQRLFWMPHDGDGRFLPSGCPTFPHWKEVFSETEFLSGGCTFWRKSVISHHRYDEGLIGYGYGDDVDVSYRISRQYKMFIEPQARCVHKEHAPGRIGGRAYRRDWIRNMFYLAWKNGISRFALTWCVLGHILRDAACRDWDRLRGDFEGFSVVVRERSELIKKALAARRVV